MRNFLFLDIDGVARPNILPNDYVLKQCLVSNINNLVSRYDMEVVISSNWREAFSLSYFNAVFNNRVIGSTASAPFNQRHSRYYEIQEFLSSIIENYDYVVLDDRPDYFPVKFPKLHLCDPSIGFDDKSYNDLICNLDSRRKEGSRSDKGPG